MDLQLVSLMVVTLIAAILTSAAFAMARVAGRRFLLALALLEVCWWIVFVGAFRVRAMSFALVLHLFQVLIFIAVAWRLGLDDDDDDDDRDDDEPPPVDPDAQGDLDWGEFDRQRDAWGSAGASSR